MRHEFDPKLLADPRAAELAKRAAAILDVDAAESVIKAEITWRRPTPETDPGRVEWYGRDRGRALVEVVLHDPYGVEVARFLHEGDLDEERLQWSLRRHWDDLLSAHTDEFIRRLKADPDQPLEFSAP